MSALHVLEDLQPLYKIFFSFNRFLNFRFLYAGFYSTLDRTLSGYVPPIFYYNLLLCGFSLEFIFFSEQPFCRNYSTLDSHTNTVISRAVVHFVKMASKTVLRCLPVRWYTYGKKATEGKVSNSREI